MAERIGILAAGKLKLEGTLEQLREAAGQAGATLEDVFLRVTAQPTLGAAAPAAPATADQRD
jgi:hypothetical protein